MKKINNIFDEDYLIYTTLIFEESYDKEIDITNLIERLYMIFCIETCKFSESERLILLDIWEIICSKIDTKNGNLIKSIKIIKYQYKKQLKKSNDSYRYSDIMNEYNNLLKIYPTKKYLKN